jgi:hypothetical protein
MPSFCSFGLTGCVFNGPIPGAYVEIFLQYGHLLIKCRGHTAPYVILLQKTRVIRGYRVARVFEMIIHP